MVASATASKWQELFEEISIPRLAGSGNCNDVVDKLAGFLAKKEYTVDRQDFYAGPERLVGGSVFGLLLALGSVIAALLVLVYPAAARVPAVAGFFAVLVLVVGLPAGIAYLIASARLYARWIVRLLGYRFPTGPGVPDGYWVRATNITAGKKDPRVWLVAHSDSKVQRHSLRTRMVFVPLALVGALLLVLASIGAVHWVVTLVGAACAMAGGLVIAVAGLRDGSPGAVDNATGVVAVLAAAEELGWRDEVGILITGAEELAMAGAREWARKGRSGNLFVNFDGVDGIGEYYLSVHHGVSPGTARSFASELRTTLRTPPGAPDAKIARWYRTLGMFVDGTILAGTGMAGVTVQRGTFFGTAAVAHTPDDIPARVDIEGAVRAGRAAASVIKGFLT